MSTPEAFGVKADRRAEPILFQHLFDDAAVFPPGLAPIRRAVTDHVLRRSSPSASMVGPLLLPATAVQDLQSLEHPMLEVSLVGRPGTSVALLGEALSRLDRDDTVSVAGIELGWSGDWRHTPSQLKEVVSAKSYRRVLSVEVPRGADLENALSDVQALAKDADLVQAKFRTGSTPEQPAPTSRQLATFVRACIDHGLSFKLTGGLHHAISAGTPAGQDHLGFLNVIAATRWALAHGAEVPEMELLLVQAHPVPILDIITGMSQADGAVVRASFTSYGCCGVMDPIGDLSRLALIEETTN